jgi:flagellin
MVINTNLAAIKNTRLLADSTTNLNKSLARLSSGSKIVSPEDDAGGLAVSLNFEAQMNRNAAANSNVVSALSYTQTRDGFLSKISKALDRMSELATLAQDSTKSTSDKSNYNQEFTALQAYISDIGTKDFNGVSLFGADSDLAVTIDSDGNTFAVSELKMNASGGDISAAVVLSSVTASGSIGTMKTAVTNVSTSRAKLGANVQRLQLTSEQLNILNENLAASVSRIKDVNVAEESTQYARQNILVQSGTAMLAQANLLPQSALRLLQ